MNKNNMSSESSLSNSLIVDLTKLYYYLTPNRRFQLAILLLLLVITSLAEMVSLGLLFPFLSALGNAKALLYSPYWQFLWSLLQVKTPYHLVSVTAVGFMISTILSNALRLLALNARLKFGAKVAADISCQVYRSNLYQPYDYHIKRNSSDLIQTLTLDTDRLAYNTIMYLLQAVSNFLLIPAIVTALVIISPVVAVTLTLVLGGAYVVIYHSRQKILGKNSKIISQSGYDKIKSVQESLGGIRNVILDNTQNLFDKTYSRNENILRSSLATNQFVSEFPYYLIDAISLSSVALLAVFMGWNGDFTTAVPILGSFALGSRRLIPALQNTFTSIAVVKGSQDSLSRILLMLHQPVNSSTILSSSKPLEFVHDLSFAEVWFRYSHDSDWVIQGLNLTIPAKSTVAFVGSTGSGKSTVGDLILGLLLPEKGNILVDGVPLNGGRLRQWQRAVAHVPQQIYLSDNSLVANIAFGISEEAIDMAQVRRAAKLAQIDGFIEGLPAGYDTYVGERGIRLSGGQRQRIGIARALYKEASVIVFDEATSALDNATEREVMGAIESLGGQFTIILIAHRLSTVERCDLVVELDRGRVVAQGSYGELMARSASFQRMAGVG